MSEQDLRHKLSAICEDLDRCAGRVGSPGLSGALLSMVLGAGLAVTACGSDVEGGEGGSGGAGAWTSSGTGAQSTAYGMPGGWGGYAPAYGVDGGYGGIAPAYGVGGFGGDVGGAGGEAGGGGDVGGAGGGGGQ